MQAGSGAGAEPQAVQGKGDTHSGLPDAGKKGRDERDGTAGLTLRGLVGVGAGGDGGQGGRGTEQPHLARAPPAQDAVDAVGGQQSWRFTFALGALGAALLRVGAAHGGGSGAEPWGRGGSGGADAPAALPGAAGTPVTGGVSGGRGALESPRLHVRAAAP